MQVSVEHRTDLASLKELIQRLQDRHVECTEAVAKKAVVDAASAAGKVTSPILVAQHLRATFCTKEWCMDHVNTPINEIVVNHDS